MSNRRYGIRSNLLSRVFSRDNTGINNDFGVAARWGGIVQTYGTQPTGTADNYSVDSGGITVKPSGVILGD